MGQDGAPGSDGWFMGFNCGTIKSRHVANANRGLRRADCGLRSRLQRCGTMTVVRFVRRRRSTSCFAAGLAIVALLAAADCANADYAETMALFRAGKYAECIEEAEKGIAEEAASE